MDTETGNSSNDAPFNEHSPLIVKENPENDDEVLEDIPPWTPLEIVVSVLAALTVAVSIGLLLTSSALTLKIAGMLGLLVPPYASFQEQKITDIEGDCLLSTNPWSMYPASGIHECFGSNDHIISLILVFNLPYYTAMEQTSEVMTKEINNLKTENGRLDAETEKLNTSITG